MESTIIIPVYNQDRDLLRACVSSALVQKDAEVILIDDGSDIPAIEHLGDGYESVIYEWQENKGVAGALNRGIELSTGKYIHWLSSDDLYYRNKVEHQVSAMKAKKYNVSYTAYENGIPKCDRVYAAAQYPTKEMLFESLKQHCFINACTVCWYSAIFDELGLFNETIVHMQDYEMILRCAEKYNFLAVNETLVRRRVHDGQMLNTLKDENERLKKEKDAEYLRERYQAVANVWVPE